MKKLILLLSVLLFSLEFVAAQDEYERSVFVSSSGDSLNYRLLEPEVMKQEKNIRWYCSCMEPVNGEMTMKNN